MQIDAVVVNASPLITLFRSGQADLLPQLFKRIVVPQAVWQEVVQDDWDDPPARELRQQSWPVLESVDISPRVAAWSRGEAITKLRSGGLWLSDELVQILLAQAGENASNADFRAVLDSVPNRPPLPGDEP